jgi:curved DNA-binding protein CbpA
MLNEAYKVLMRDDQRREYDASICQMRVPNGTNYSSLGYSSWKGPLRPQALFVDENACIGHFPTQNSALFVYQHFPIVDFCSLSSLHHRISS